MMRRFVPQRGDWKFAVGLLVLMLLFLHSKTGYAVVGQAERLDEVVEEDLKEFQEALVHEELDRELALAEDMATLIKNKKKELEEVDGDEKKVLEQEIELLEEELLGIPKRKRFKFFIDFGYDYDPNINRDTGDGKSDTILDGGAGVEVDVSGRKTDLRWEIRSGRQWNIVLSERDFWTAEETLRYRRKYFAKTTHFAQSRVSRTSSKTIEIDDQRIQWQSNQNTSLNYKLTEKLSINGSANVTHRIFTQEAFDEDSGWQVSFSPSFFWNFTPKSRVSLGYSFGASRSRIESGDANSHDFNIGYFGKITSKSSGSMTAGFTHQSPQSIEGSTVNTVTAGIGHIWQITPKTQMTTQFFRSLSNTTSESVEGTDDTSTRTDNRFTNDQLTISLNSRLHRKLTATLTVSASHLKTESDQVVDEEDDPETRQFTVPISFKITYTATRWMRLFAGYTYSFRTGNEDSDSFKSNIWDAGANLRF